MKYIFETFSGVSEFIQTIGDRPVKEGWGTLTSQTDDESWTMTKSYENATDLALHGDKDSAAKVNKSLKKIRDAKTGYEERAQNKMRRSVMGSRPCVPAAIIGHPCSMYRRDTIKINKPVVTVFYSVSMCGSTKAEQLADAGAKMAEAVQIVERSGVRINLFAGNTSCTSSQTIGCFVRIKDSAKDFDLLRMAYALINPSFFRRHWFHWAETKKELITKEWRFGYGRPLYRDEEDSLLKNLRSELIKCDYLFTTSNVDRMTADEIANKILGK